MVVGVVPTVPPTGLSQIKDTLSLQLRSFHRPGNIIEHRDICALTFAEAMEVVRPRGRWAKCSTCLGEIWQKFMQLDKHV